MASGVRSLALAFLILALSAGSGQAAVFTVTSFGDGPDAAAGNGVCAATILQGACTLRAAVMEANALAGPDTIVLPAGTYGVGSTGGNEDLAATGDLDVTAGSVITITGAGAAVTDIVQNTIDRLIDVRPGGTLTINDLELEAGYLSDQATDGVGNGAGIRSEGTLVANRLVFKGMLEDFNAPNRDGAGLAVDGGTGTVSDSLFINNVIVLGSGSGQAAVVSAGTLTLRNVTATDNTVATGGVFAATGGGHLVLQGVTAIGNAAVPIDRAGGIVDVSFTLAGGPLGPCATTSPAAVHLLAGNVFDQATPCSDAGDAMPRLGFAKVSTLQFVGVLPQVLVPLAGSPAIDTGAACGTLTTDARGGARPQGGSCDAGAVEVGSLSDVQVSGAGPATAQSTDAVTDTFVVTNAGSDPSRAVTVTIATTGPGTLFGLATSKGTCAVSQRTCVLGDLAAGQTVVVRADLRAGGRGTLQATLRAKHLTLERVTTNDLATIKTAIKPDTTKPVLVQSAATLHVGSKRSASIRFTCPATERTCTGTIKPTFRGKHLRTVRVKLIGGRGVTVKVALDATARRLIRHGSRLKATFAVNVVDAAGNRFRATLRTTIRK